MITLNWYVKIFYHFDGGWKAFRIYVPVMMWHRLNSQDPQVAFEAVCWIREHVQFVLRRLEDAKRGGYD